MNYKMRLYNDAFISIAYGKKTIEMRLNDEKRKLLRIGDFIEFENTLTHEKVTCEIINLYYYKNFDELYKHHDKIAIGYKENEVSSPKDMLVYYTKEDIEKYGVVGIELKK